VGVSGRLAEIQLPIVSFEDGPASLPISLDVREVDMAGDIEVEDGDVLDFSVRTEDTEGYFYQPESTLGYAGGQGARRNKALTDGWAEVWAESSIDFGFRIYVRTP
jgi:hypothetical protein